MPLDAIGPADLPRPFRSGAIPSPALPPSPPPPPAAFPPEPAEPPAEAPPPKRHRSRADLDALFPIPPAVSLDAADAARALLAGVDAEGVRLRRADRALCLAVVQAGGAASFSEAGRMFRLSRLHLSDPA